MHAWGQGQPQLGWTSVAWERLGRWGEGKAEVARERLGRWGEGSPELVVLLCVVELRRQDEVHSHVEALLQECSHLAVCRARGVCVCVAMRVLSVRECVRVAMRALSVCVGGLGPQSGEAAAKWATAAARGRPPSSGHPRQGKKARRVQLEPLGLAPEAMHSWGRWLGLAAGSGRRGSRGPGAGRLAHPCRRALSTCTA